MTYSSTIIGAPVSKETEHLYRFLLILMNVLKRCTVEVGESYIFFKITTYLGIIGLFSAG